MGNTDVSAGEFSKLARWRNEGIDNRDIIEWTEGETGVVDSVIASCIRVKRK